VWKDKRDVCLLTNIHDPPREGNYRDEHGNAIKLAIVADYNRHMGHVDNSERLANSYMASRRTWKWTNKLFFHLLDLATVNSYILLRIFMRWEENFTQRFSSRPYQRDAGTVWAWATTIHAVWEDQPQLLLTSEDWTHVTISTGLAAILNSSIVACVQRGAWREPCYSIVSSVTWRFVWTEVVLKITTQKTTYKTYFLSFSVQIVGAST